jgi:hypothetical protein
MTYQELYACEGKTIRSITSVFIDGIDDKGRYGWNNMIIIFFTDNTCISFTTHLEA